MKRNWWKKAAGLGLALTAAMGLSACGGEKNENAALAKEGVYRFQEITLPEIEGDYYYISDSAHKNGRIYLIVQVENWNTEENSGTSYTVLSMNEDGSDVKTISLELPETDDNGGNGDLDVDEPIDETEPEEGTDTTEPTEGEDSEDGEEDVGEDGDVDPGFGIMGRDTDNFWEYTYYYGFMIGENGEIYGQKQYQYERYGEEYYSFQKYYVNKWDSQGKLLSETEVMASDPEKTNEWINFIAGTAGEDGSVYMIFGVNGETAYVVTVDAQGNASEKKELPEETGRIFLQYNRMVRNDDGSFLITYSDENDWTKQFIVSYDPATGVLGESFPMPGTLAARGFNTIISGIGSDLLLSDSNGVYSYNIGDEDVSLKMNFMNSDFDTAYFNSLVELDSTSFVGIFSDNYSDELKAGLFSYVQPEDIEDKSVLVMAGEYINSDMKRRAVEFNRSSDTYRIVIKDYDTYNTYDDWNAGVTQLNNDITTGKMPDILIGSSSLPMENYVAKGLLADIGQLIEEDEELSQTEFVQNVFDAYSFEGTLYYIIPSFNVETMIGKTSLIGDRAGWTMEEAEQLLATMPEGTKLFGEMTRDSYFSTAMGYCAGDFVDVTTGKCDFNSDRFIKLMEYAKNLPESLDEDYYDDDYYMNYQTQYRENRTILMQLYINSIRDLNYNINGRFGEDVSYVGFPMEGGQGACINANSIYAISSKCSFTEGAWEFLRYYLTDEYQSDMEWNLPVNKKYFMENAQRATERPYWEDPETGEKEYYDDSYYMNGESIIIQPLSQEQVDKVVNYIFSLEKSSYYNSDVMNIINEEMGGFFAGQKSAQEVAGVIQNRVQLYVDENR